MQQEWRNTKTDNLFKAVMSLKNLLECEKFFRDLLTIQEIEEFANRWEVVRLLDQDVAYRSIAKQTGVSTATVTRINYWLHQGMGGYKLALTRTKPSSTPNSHAPAGPVAVMSAISAEPSSTPAILLRKIKKEARHKPGSLGSF